MFARRGLRLALCFSIVSLTGAAWIGPLLSADEAPPQSQPAAGGEPVKPKPLSQHSERGLAYLVSQQHEDGGWGQGGGWRRNNQGGRIEGENVEDPSDLGNTCIATLALIRAGNTPQEGKYAQNVARAVRFVRQQVDNSDNDGLYVTDVRDTQLQQKIGPYVDTFLAGLVLSELKGKVPADEEQPLVAALKKTISKIEKNQQEDGTFAGNQAWAPVLSLGLCSKLLNRAAQQDVAVKDEVLRRDYQQSLAALDRKPGEVKTKGVAAAPSIAVGGRLSSGDAGVPLYNSASNAGRISHYFDTNQQAAQSARKVLEDKSATPADREKAGRDLAQAEEVRRSQESALSDVVDNLADKQFVAGFGNNGGEEFLSYMNISEMLVAQGGDKWRRWDESVTANLERVQNQDGSWSGQHCITGRTFCTATALLTLMADRATTPLANQMKGQK